MKNFVKYTGGQKNTPQSFIGSEGFCFSQQESNKTHNAVWEFHIQQAIAKSLQTMIYAKVRTAQELYTHLILLFVFINDSFLL